MKSVGILGGMGPAATVDLHAKIIAATGAARDQDHLRVLVDSNPALPDRHAAIEAGGPSPGPLLGAMAAGLERAGADLIVMACNTAHAFQADIEAAIRVPFVSMIDAAVDATVAAAPAGRRIGLLAATGCVRAGLYQTAFAARGVDVLTADDEAFMALVWRIKAGDVGAEVRMGMRALANDLLQRDVGAVVAGCTEVPLVLAQADVRAPLIDSATALAAEVVKMARG